MNNTQEFIYKGYFEGLNKHDRVFINYYDIMPYRKGQLILGGVA